MPTLKKNVSRCVHEWSILNTEVLSAKNKLQTGQLRKGFCSNLDSFQCCTTVEHGLPEMIGRIGHTSGTVWVAGTDRFGSSLDILYIDR